ncbi:hypothetical protein [Halomarina pelagica]|uniref:hypothetical protein n=1 Tax=Halomarina pelagica TaxID=2961599 RepID=UPI0020C49EA1|nr:hypothetical protein [Halomarina sp. BND7]
MTTTARVRRTFTHRTVWVALALLSPVWVVIAFDIPRESILLSVIQTLAIPGYLLLVAVNLVNHYTLQLPATHPALYVAAAVLFYLAAVLFAVFLRKAASVLV